jgi:hypothetical protein
LNERQSMKPKVALKIISLSLFCLNSNNLIAQTLDTNIEGLVIKNYKCGLYSKWVDGNLVNRNAEPFVGKLRVKIIDPENDILWQGTTNLNVGGQNGAVFSVQLGVGTCLAPNKVQITLER